MKYFLLPKVRRDFTVAQERNRRSQAAAVDVSQAQWASFRSVWADCVADVPYYRGLVGAGRAPHTLTSWEDFRALPVLTRKILQDRPQEFIRDSGPPHGFMKTAGSTGTPLQIGMSHQEKDLMRVIKLAAWQQFGYVPSSRLFLIWGHSHLLGTGWQGRVNHLKRKVADTLLGYHRVDAYRMNARLCRAHAQTLIRFRPLGLIGYAAALDLFARYTLDFREQFRRLGLRFVLATSEPAPRPDTFSMLEDLFACPVVQEYGGAEFGQVAFKVGEAPFHVYSDLNYLECHPSDRPGSGGLLITSLYPRYAPLIRYVVGDAVEGGDLLPHGHIQNFQAVAGRVNDVLALAGGDHIHSVSIFHCIHQELSVHNIQMVLEDAGIEIRLISTLRGDGRNEMEARVRGRLKQVHPVLGKAQFRYVEDIETNRAGKRRWFVDRRSRSPGQARADDRQNPG